MPKKKENLSKTIEPSYKLSAKEIAEFQKISHVGAEKASQALSILINEDVRIKAVNARALPVEKIAEVVGGPEDISSTVILRAVGDVAGSILLIFPQKHALALADLLARRPLSTSKRLNKLDESALKETGNILSGSFLAALTSHLNVSMVGSIPDLATGMAKATVDYILAEFSKKAEKALAFEVDFELVSATESISVFFFLLLDLQSATKVLKMMGGAFTERERERERERETIWQKLKNRLKKLLELMEYWPAMGCSIKDITESSYKLKGKELEEFKKIGEIGAKNCSTALSRLIGEEVMIRTVRVSALPVEKIPESMGNPEDIATSVIFRVIGDVEGNILIVFPYKEALVLSDLLSQRLPGTARKLTKLDESAIKETGNILSGSFLAALTNYLDINMLESIPDIVSEMAKATVDHILAEFGVRAEKALAFEVDFEFASPKIRGYFFLLLDLDSATRVLKEIKKKFEG